MIKSYFITWARTEYVFGKTRSTLLDVLIKEEENAKAKYERIIKEFEKVQKINLGEYEIHGIFII